MDFYLRHAVLYRDLEEIMTERAAQAEHATLNRWFVKYSPMIDARVPSKKRPTLRSWRMDKTYVRVRGKWMYLCRAVDIAGNTLDFMLTERRNWVRLQSSRLFVIPLLCRWVRRPVLRTDKMDRVRARIDFCGSCAQFQYMKELPLLRRRP